MYVHGDNLTQKENHKTKYTDNTSKQYLREIKQYDKWKTANETLKGPYLKKTKRDSKIIQARVRMLNEYKDFVDQQPYAEKFDSRSNLHSSILEEFIFYLFADLVSQFSDKALIGKARAFKDIFFQAKNYAQIEIKDHDFVIGINIKTDMNCEGSTYKQTEIIQVPAVAIECKTYLDKTMLEGSSTAGLQLLSINPNAMYVVVAEWLKLTDKVNLKKYRIDQIFVLRKQKNTDREFRYDEDYVKNPIYSDVVEAVFNMVREHLTTTWDGSVQSKLETGLLI
jgi:hypothetical protein